jgi:hypothetical protein
MSEVYASVQYSTGEVVSVVNTLVGIAVVKKKKIIPVPAGK